MRSIVKACGFLVIGLCVGFFGARTVAGITPGGAFRVDRERESNSQGLVNPLLDCTEAESGNRDLVPFEAKITALVDKRVALGSAQNISVYFRDLNNGPWISIDGNRKFSPASLLKIPVAMSYFLWEQEKRGVLDEELVWNKDIQPQDEGIASIQANTPYRVRELIRRMLTMSDNAATYLLTEHLPARLLLEPYNDLGLEAPQDTDTDYEISVRNYAKIIRVLYNASYLNRADSEEILRILTQSEFTEGLRAGVPRSVQVANKYGRRNHANTTELHDCGIVYYPGNPYLLCIMTQGTDADRMGDAIQSISALVYHEVDLQRSK